MTLPMQHDLDAPGRVVETYDAKCIGAPFKVILADGFRKEHNAQTGKTVIEIEDLPGLVAAVVRSRVMHPRKLSGEDLKFIRSVLCMKAVKIAGSLDLTAEHYSRCENGTKTMSVATEKLYRMFVFLSVATRNKMLTETVKEDLKNANISAEEAQKAVTAFQKIFHDMRIDPVRLVGPDLCFTFCRRCGADLIPRGCDDGGKWRDQLDRAA